MKSEKMKWYILIAVALVVGAIIGYFATANLATTGNARNTVSQKVVSQANEYGTGTGYFFDCCCNGTDDVGCPICRCFNTGSPLDTTTETYIDNK